MEKTSKPQAPSLVELKEHLHNTHKNALVLCGAARSTNSEYGPGRKLSCARPAASCRRLLWIRGRRSMEPAAESDAEMLGTPDPELAATMGFSGFGKKARTFDLEAMFEQTRRTAVERSRKVLEAREREKEDQTEKEFRIPCTASSVSASSATGPGPTLTGREAACSEGEDNSNEAFSGPSMQSQSSAKGPAEDTDDDDDEEFIGPPLPPGFKDSDDDNDNDDTEEEDNSKSSQIFDEEMIYIKLLELQTAPVKSLESSFVDSRNVCCLFKRRLWIFMKMRLPHI